MHATRLITPHLLLALLLVTGCTKKGEQLLPNATTTGARTFGCLVDGKVFIAENIKAVEGIFPGISGGYFNERDKDFLLSSSSPTPEQGLNAIDFELYKLTHTGTYPAGGGADNKIMLDINGRRQSTDSIHTGVINVTRLDTTGGNVRILSGTFEATVGDKAGVTQLTKGRFDYAPALKLRL